MPLEMDSPSTPLPRVTIEFCTECQWLLRAAYFAQELLSTFSTSLAEVALQPSVGGTFVVQLYTAAPATSKDEPITIQRHLLWDRKTEGGFPEAKELKRRVRDIIDPNRNLGHIDRKKKPVPQIEPEQQQQPQPASYHPKPSAMISPPIPRAINRLQVSESQINERKFTPMDVDVSSRPASSKGGEEEVVNSRGKIVIGGGEGYGFCRPGEDCEDCG